MLTHTSARAHNSPPPLHFTGRLLRGTFSYTPIASLPFEKGCVRSFGAVAFADNAAPVTAHDVVAAVVAAPVFNLRADVLTVEFTEPIIRPEPAGCEALFTGP